MPSIEDAMLASLARGVSERDILSSVSSIKDTFSSWDSCMAKTYCKWPVIAGIIVGGLILLSILACIIRCACCGVSCCCACFSCLKCCGNCCGACDDPRDKKHKHVDDEYFKPDTATHGYQAPMPMMTRGIGGPAPAPPTYAQFEVGPNGHAIAPRAVNEDALPPMPSWDTASKKHVMTEEEQAVELKDMDHKMPLMSGAVPTSRAGSPGVGTGPPSPYSEHPAQGHDYITAGAMGAGMLGRGPLVGQYGRGGNDMNRTGTPGGQSLRGPNDGMGTPAGPFPRRPDGASRMNTPNGLPPTRGPVDPNRTYTPVGQIGRGPNDHFRPPPSRGQMGTPDGRPPPSRGPPNQFGGNPMNMAQRGPIPYNQTPRPFAVPQQTMTPPAGQNQYDQYFDNNNNNNMSMGNNRPGPDRGYSNSPGGDRGFAHSHRQFTNETNRGSPAPSYVAPQPQRPFHAPMEVPGPASRILSPVPGYGGERGPSPPQQQQAGGYPGYQPYQAQGQQNQQRW